MPGPCAQNRSTRPASPNSPTKKVQARLAARQAARPVTKDKYSQGWNAPGSQNRKK